MYYVYILASGPNGTLYTGHTDSLIVRVGQHRDELRPHSFTSKYGIKRLVWYEEQASRTDAKLRETRIKKWNRDWKIRQIREMNPGWRDLYEDLFR
jgi:putative endonuclease